MAQGVLGISGGDYWTDPFKNQTSAMSALIDGGWRGLQLDAPPQVAIDASDDLPIILVRVWEAAVGPFVDVQRVAVLVAVDRETGQGYAAPAFSSDRGRPRPPARPPVTPLAPATHANAYAMRARARLSLPWQPSELLFTLIARELVSDRVRVRLGPATGGFRDPEVERFLAEQRARAPMPSVWPAQGSFLPSYTKRSESPSIPEAPGVALSLDRVLVMLPTTRVILHGSFRAKLHIARVGRPSAWPDTYNVPTAVVPILLVATGSEVSHPFVWKLAVASYDTDEQMASTGEVSGYFSLDLEELGAVKEYEQTLFFYAFCGEAMTGPVPVGFVAENRLPK